MSNLKGIAVRSPSLADAQALFIKEAKDASGNATPFGFTHSKNILAELRKNETATQNSTVEKSNKTATMITAEKHQGFSKQTGSRKKGSKVSRTTNL